MSPEWRKVNLICSTDADGHVELRHQPIVPMRTDLLELFDIGELKKYMTEDELTGLPGAAAAANGQSTAEPAGAEPTATEIAAEEAPSAPPLVRLLASCRRRARRRRQAKRPRRR